MYAAAIAALLVAYFIFRRWIQGRDSPDQTTRLDGKVRAVKFYRACIAQLLIL
jgi:hypothetical protein